MTDAKQIINQPKIIPAYDKHLRGGDAWDNSNIGH